MKKILIFISVCLSFSGCLYFNERGVSQYQYNDCKEYYDSVGKYHKDCPAQLVEW